MAGMSDLLARSVSASGEREPEGASKFLEQAAKGKWLAGGASALMLVAVLWPISQNWREGPKDSFPLSHYPMFTAKRSGSVRITHLVGTDPMEVRYHIPYTYASSGGLNQVRRQINRTVREGRTEALCDFVAARIAEQEKGTLVDVVRVQLVIGKYRLADYFAGETRPVSENILAFSEVSRNLG